VKIASGPFLVSRNGDGGSTKSKDKMCQRVHQTRLRAFIHFDSRTVATEVGNR